jgi:hypothetical protein
MCLIISGIFLYLSYIFFQDGDTTSGIINGIIGIFFFLLIFRNILKTRKEKQNKGKTCQED